MGLFVIVLAVLALVAFGGIAYDMYKYRVGTPTTATIDHCTYGGRSKSCTAAWNIGGSSHTGPVIGRNYSHSAGSSLDVHVYGDTAYTADVADAPRELGPAVAPALVALVALTAW